MAKPKVALFKFASCSGCQLVFLNCEEELLDVVGAVDIVYFIEGKRDNLPGPYDISFVEGSITTEEEIERLHKIREDSALVVAIGACANGGGLQGMKNFASVEEYKRTVYPHPEWIDSLPTSKPIAEYVKVDAALRGCPIDKNQLLELVISALAGKSPALRAHSVCVECKLRENICVAVTKEAACLGPVTMAGCGALCPSLGRGCYGCFGPNDDPNGPSLARVFASRGMSNEEIVRQFRQYYGDLEPFRKAVEAYER